VILQRARSGRSTSPDEAPEYWVTYSDLMVSLLVVFALLLFLTLSKMQREVARARSTLEANNKTLAIAAEQMGDLGRDLRFDPKTQTLTMDAQVLFAYGSDVLRPEASETIKAIATRFLPRLPGRHCCQPSTARNRRRRAH